MEYTLKCNVLKCRKELSDQALVTTCSHIFCFECSRRHGLTGPAPVQGNTCPACSSQLTKPGDAVVAHLNPTEEYKTSILSGLRPDVIMECAGRALSFWAYQTSQEIIYQRYVEKTLTEKLKSLKTNFEKTVGDADAEIASMREKLQALSNDHDDVRRNHEELTHAYQNKCRKLIQVRELYDRVKREAELGQMEVTAPDAVDSSIQFRTHAPNSNLPESTARLDSYERQTEPAYHASYHPVGPDRGNRRAYASGGSGAFWEDMAWPKPRNSQGGVVQTPGGTPRGPGVESHTRFGLSTTLSLAAGSPSTRVAPGILWNAPNPRHPSVCHGRSLGIGLSSGIRTSHISHGNHGSHGSVDHNAAHSYPRAARRSAIVPATFGHMPGP